MNTFLTISGKRRTGKTLLNILWRAKAWVKWKVAFVGMTQSSLKAAINEMVSICDMFKVNYKVNKSKLIIIVDKIQIHFVTSLPLMTRRNTIISDTSKNKDTIIIEDIY